MELRRFCLVIALGMLCLLLGKAQQASFIVLNPQQNWYQYNATLEEATITLHPVGLYTEVGLYFTVSANETPVQKGTQLEAVLNFSLPANSIVNDSWLWIDTTIIRAKILDRWTASTIYENIVNRRRDPSILTKEGNDRYTLRIYPLIMGERRKVKINYLVPGNWSTQTVQTLLPANILRSTNRPTPAFNIRAFLEGPWQNPALPSHPELIFRAKNDPKLGKYYEAVVPAKSLDNRDLSFSLNAPLKNGVFLSRFGDEQQGYYQMALFPDQILASTQNLKPKHLMVLLHYSQTTAANGFTQAQLLEQIRNQLKRVLRPEDYFNVTLAGISPRVVSKTWIQAAPTKMDSVFLELGKGSISGINLPGLLAKGIETIKASGTEGAKVLLFANSNSEWGLDMGNELIKELSILKGSSDIPFYILDYTLRNTTYNYINGRPYWGNEYFYINWSRQTQGDYLQMYSCCNIFENAVSKILDLTLIEAGALDLHTALQNGFCYNRYNLNQGANEGINDLRKPVLQVGRYQGKWPFVVELSGSHGDKLFFDGLTVPSYDVNITDSTGVDTWVGNFIAGLEKNSFSNSNTAEIIRASIRERVLSLYTAFLCLEPAQGGEPCLNCLDQSQGSTVGTRDLQDSLVLSKISPNPFRERVMIQLKFKELIDLSKAHISVYNHLGQVVRTFSDVPKGKVQDLELHWDGNSDGGEEVPPGVYIFRLQTPSGQYSRKLVKLDR
ncbi:VIT domain-containing protein [Haliscomenobacter sp.]|uniref:VIT domain-containing protein n=1 Tax=Haliscomenobacter sp. TaxID=2717303 RepID=UPI003BA9D2C9